MQLLSKKQIYSSRDCDDLDSANVPFTAGGAGNFRRWRRADTNVIAIKFDKLTGPSNMHTGDPVYCSNEGCQAVLSHMAKLTQQENDKVL